ncbi:MAG: hypothetical protein ACHQAY_12385 [Hyphomicrobiales bacterium]
MGKLPTVAARAYIATFAALAFAGFALIAALGLVVDGYGVFGTRLIPASRFPPQLRLSKYGDRVTKAIEIAERQGDEILFTGDSRTLRGLDPDSPALSGLKGYNAALVGATLAEQIVALDWSLAHEPGIRRIVWGLSIETFPSPILTFTDYPDSAFAGRSIASGLLRHLFAYKRVVSSWRALLQATHREVRAQMKRNGLEIYSDPVEGPAIAELFGSELTGIILDSGRFSQEKIDKALAELRQRLIELKAAGIDVDLAIVPVHIWRLEFLRLIGVEAQDDAWRRSLAAIVDELAAAPGTGKLRLFDFARPHPFVEQPVFTSPPPGERRYFVESSHFYPWLGDKVLAKLFGKPQEPEKDMEPFGVEIGKGPGSASIDEDIASAKAGIDLWEAAHGDDVSYVKRLISK